jgi:hypothetical protein
MKEDKLMIEKLKIHQIKRRLRGNLLTSTQGNKGLVPVLIA